MENSTTDPTISYMYEFTLTIDGLNFYLDNYNAILTPKKSKIYRQKFIENQLSLIREEKTMRF